MVKFRCKNPCRLKPLNEGAYGALGSVDCDSLRLRVTSCGVAVPYGNQAGLKARGPQLTLTSEQSDSQIQACLGELALSRFRVLMLKYKMLRSVTVSDVDRRATIVEDDASSGCELRPQHQLATPLIPGVLLCRLSSQSRQTKTAPRYPRQIPKMQTMTSKTMKTLSVH